MVSYIYLVKRFLILVLLLVAQGQGLEAQPAYLGDNQAMALADSCIRNTYALDFGRARSNLQKLKNRNPTHPAPPFLAALIIYWENFPLTPGNDQAEEFIRLMDESVARAAGMTDRDDTHVEGVFFDLFGRAFKAMFWADNDKITRAAADLGIMYKRTKEGKLLKEKLPEFYFSTGLYNYYIEAYPEAHPIYKPFVSFMQDGNKDMGLRQLQIAIDRSVFLKVEATLFMALIQMNYEEDLNTAALYAERLVGQYPRNMYYQGLVITLWLHQHRYEKVREILKETQTRNDSYSILISTLAKAFLAEKNDLEKEAAEGYQSVIGQAEEIGPMAHMFMAMAYMGLSRLHEKRDLQNAANRYARKAGTYTPYHFILDER